jgi:hypothetical protein
MDEDQENNLQNAVAGGCVSRRWLLKSTAKFAAGTVALSALGAAAAGEAETPPAGRSGPPVSEAVKEAPEAVVDIWDRF